MAAPARKTPKPVVDRRSDQFESARAKSEELVGVRCIGRVGDAQVLGADEVHEDAHQAVIELSRSGR
jgi:hypothetical protein